MSLDSSGISWTDGTLNSLYGCSKCSVGCRNCYAVSRIRRHSSNPRVNADGRFNGLIEDDQFTGKILFEPKHLYSVLKARKPKRIFVNEFSDLFHELVPLEVILEHIRVVRAAPQHQFQVLTKRSRRLGQVDKAILSKFGSWPANLWLGASVCSAQKTELQRIAQLGTTAAKLKWISFEPWISDVNRPLRDSHLPLSQILQDSGISWTVIGG